MGFDLYTLYVLEVCPLEYAEVQARRDEHQAMSFALLDWATDIDEAKVLQAKNAWSRAEAACRAAFKTRRPELNISNATPGAGLIK